MTTVAETQGPLQNGHWGVLTSGSGVAGQALSTQPQLVVRDSNGNLVESKVETKKTN